MCLPKRVVPKADDALVTQIVGPYSRLLEQVGRPGARGVPQHGQSRTTRGLPSGPRRCSCPCSAERAGVASSRFTTTNEEGRGCKPRPSSYCRYTGLLAAAAGLRSATTAQLADQHPTAEYHHGDRPEGGGQEDVGAAGYRQVLLPGRGGGLGVVASPLWASLITPATARPPELPTGLVCRSSGSSDLF